jgi:hypothetical protein
MLIEVDVMYECERLLKGRFFLDDPDVGQRDQLINLAYLTIVFNSTALSDA